MGEKNTDIDIVSASDEGSNLPGKLVDSMNNVEHEQGSPTKKENVENNGVEETIEAKTCNYQIEDSDKEDNRKKQLVEGNEQNKVVAQEVGKLDQVNKDTAGHYNKPKEVVEPESEKNEAVEQENDSKEVVPEEVARQGDENKHTLGLDNDFKELDASENLVKAAAEDKSPNKEIPGGITGDTKAAGEDGQMKMSRDVNEEEIVDNNEVKESRKNKGDIDKEMMEVEQEYKHDTSENESVEVERNSEEKNVAVKNDLESEQEEGKPEGSSNEEDKDDEDMRPKKRKRRENEADKTRGGKKDGQGQITPVSSVSSRPVRERKSVERLVASIEKDVIREIFVEKGSGVALKDIPNVAYKLSKKKNDETFKQLHTILFGRRGKAIQMKNHVSQFSGFVWHDNEEKCKMKVREKFDKLVKEKLIEFCDVLDIPITNKVTTKKEDVVTKIMDFLASPHPTTDDLLSEKEHSEKTTKRKRSVGPGSPTHGSAKGSRKRRRKASEKHKESGKDESGSDGESDKEEEEVVTGNQGNGNGKLNQSEDESSDKKSSESEDAKTSEDANRRQRLKKTSVKVDSSAKKKTKPKALNKPDLNDAEKAKKVDSKNNKQSLNKSSTKTGSTRKARSSTITTEKKKQVKGVPEKEPNIKTKNADPKGKPKEEKLKPSDKVLRDQICRILKEVDFNTATFTDILKLLEKHFKTDLTPRKASVKLVIQEELTKMADDGDGDGDDEEQDITPEPAKVNA